MNLKCEILTGKLRKPRSVLKIQIEVGLSFCTHVLSNERAAMAVRGEIDMSIFHIKKPQSDHQEHQRKLNTTHETDLLCMHLDFIVSKIVPSDVSCISLERATSSAKEEMSVKLSICHTTEQMYMTLKHDCCL